MGSVFRSLENSQVPKYIFHSTAKVNRGAIKRYGLLARQPFHHPRGNFRRFEYLGTQPIGVYGERTHEQARVWAYRGVSGSESRDVWRIRTAGLPIEPDPQVDTAWVIICNVPPKYLRLVETY